VAKACPITELDLCRNNKQCAVTTHGHKGAQLHAWSHSPWERERKRENTTWRQLLYFPLIHKRPLNAHTASVHKEVSLRHWSWEDLMCTWWRPKERMERLMIKRCMRRRDAALWIEEGGGNDGQQKTAATANQRLPLQVTF